MGGVIHFSEAFVAFMGYDRACSYAASRQQVSCEYIQFAEMFLETGTTGIFPIFRDQIYVFWFIDVVLYCYGYQRFGAICCLNIWILP